MNEETDINWKDFDDSVSQYFRQQDLMMKEEAQREIVITELNDEYCDVLDEFDIN